MSTAAPASHNIIAERLGPNGCTGRIILDRPRALNALTVEMCVELQRVVKEWTADNSGLRCILLRGAGGKAFCAGGDVKSIALQSADLPSGDRPGKPGSLASDFFREEYQADYALASITPALQVSFWDGIVMGGGVGVSVHGAFRVATEASLFAMPETGIGLFPDVGASFVLPRLPGGIGNYLGLTGQRLKAEDLLYCGLATHYVPRERLESLEAALIAGNGDGGIGGTNFVAAALSAHSEPLDTAGSLLERNRAAIDECFGRSALRVEDILTRLDARQKAGCSWAAETAAALETMSPTSLKITLRQLQRGKELTSLAEALKMEFRLSQHVARAPDFAEGVKAKLVDKGRSPVWQPPFLAGVSVETVEAAFGELGELELQLPGNGGGSSNAGSAAPSAL